MSGGAATDAGKPPTDAGDKMSDASPNDRPEGGSSQTRCGDGLVTGEEKCDTGIEAGKPGACPTDCPSLGACADRVLVGSGCQAECTLKPANCQNDDHCCPVGCKHDTDNDCSQSCGDGIVQPPNETCEPGSKTPCKTAADCDDGKACTTDTITGSPENCNVECKNEEITSIVNDDGCCPKGANANADSDCQPSCGNNVREKGEECDGSTGCSSACKLTLQQDQIDCLDKFANDDCEKCSCMNCVGANQYLACREADAKAGDSKCADVLACARKNNCVGMPCYCPNSGICGQGPCAAEIEKAAGAAAGDFLTVYNESTRVGSLVYVTDATDSCRVTNCSTECR